MYKSITEIYFNRFAQSEAPRNRPAFALVISKLRTKECCEDVGSSTTSESRRSPVQVACGFISVGANIRRVLT
jgi:hypothetical protein